MLTLVSGTTCKVCGSKANVKAVEILPDGLVMEATHADGVLHKWVKYFSLDSICRRKTGRPKIITCPRCGHKGIVNSFRPDQTRPDLVKYVIRHEKLDGTWGRGNVPKYRRCYISNKEERKVILMKLNRYIVAKKGR